MDTIALGGNRVHRLGFGAMRITGPGVWGPPKDRDNAIRVLRRAVELGVELIDTADAYGPDVSEQLVAEALFPYTDRLVITTKAGQERPEGRWQANGHPRHLKSACLASLKRLRMDQIPLYQLHRPDPAVPFEESVGALVELQREGKIRDIGVSNVSVEQLRLALAITPVVSVQNAYSVADRASEPVLRFCESNDLAFMAWAPAQYADDMPAVRDVATRRGMSTRQVALAWVLACSPATIPIPGTGSVEHLEDNMAARDVQLDADEIDALNASRPG
jgi:aryl-alcohol dehydrogenase-like predicted oxidoreductase